MKLQFLQSTLVICVFVAYTNAQTLLDAISQFPELSNFTTLMRGNPRLAGALLTSNASSLTTQSTILVPDNSAFAKVSVLYNVSMSNLSVEQLEPYLQYHLLVGQVTTENLTQPDGVTVPTFLTSERFNNRTAGEALGSSGADGDIRNGQVVFFQAKSQNGTTNGQRKFMIRQLQNPTIDAQGGLGHMINLTAVDGVWDGGYFQIVDKFLSLPLNCTDSIRRWRMTAFRSSLDRTGLGAPLDITRNVTCFTPNDQAFLAAGSPNVTANITDLEKLVKFHTVVEPLYSDFLADGQTYTTFSNETIRISIREGNIFVNDAKIINKNVMTNNGVMHVLDRVMSPLDKDTVSTAIATPTTTRSSVPLDTVTVTPTTGSSSTSSALAGITTAHSSSSWLLTMLTVLGGFLA